MPYQLVRNQHRPPQSGAVLLCDTSTSMCSIDTPGGVKRRIDHLAEVLAGVLSKVRVAHLLTFDTYVRELPLGTQIQIEPPSGSTALHLALEFVSELPGEISQLILLTDGSPDNDVLALAAMQRLQHARPMLVRAYYCGAEGDRVAMAFLQRLIALAAPGSTVGRFNLSEPLKVTGELVLRLTHQPDR
jgi:hypothetical protein